MEKRVLLVTLQGDNYGNRLQNYALQTVLKKNGCEVYTPFYDPVEFEKSSSKIKFLIKALIGYLGGKKWKKDYFRFRRLIRYEKFNARFIDNRFKIDYSNVNQMNWDKFDYAVTGSDQVWHGWSKNEDELRFFYLSFIDKKKRMAYAPSFGFTAFPDENIDIHKKGLSEISFISSREQSGADLVESLVGRKSCVVLDPTLLLTAEDWNDFEEKPRMLKSNRYIAVYFLGEARYKKEIEVFSKEKGLEIVDLNNKESLSSRLIAPEEFVWIIHHAEYVFTDSFHACVFSLLFKKHFLVFERVGKGTEGMFDRITDLMDVFGTKDRICYNGNLNQIVGDYSIKDITRKRNESMDFLKQIL